MKKKIMLGSAVLLVLSSCVTNQKRNDIGEENIVQIEVDLNQKEEKQVERFFEYDTFITLETNKSCLISNISKIEFYKDNIYILDSSLGTLFVFDSTGKHLFNINKKGRGPGEYLLASDFVIDKKSQRIYIYDGLYGALLSYDLDGNFLEKKEIEKGFSLYRYDDYWLVYLGNGVADRDDKKEFYNLFIYDKEFNLVEKYLPFNKYMLGLKNTFGFTKCVFSNYNDSLYILPLLSNDIYYFDVNQRKLNIAYQINFKGGQSVFIDPKDSENEVKRYLAEIKSGNVASKVSHFYKLKDKIFFRFVYGDRFLSCVYDDKSTLCDFNFDDNGLVFRPIVYESDKPKTQILSVVSGSEFEICKKLDKKNSAVIREINRKINQIEDPNSVLIFYNVKD